MTTEVSERGRTALLASVSSGNEKAKVTLGFLQVAVGVYDAFGDIDYPELYRKVMDALSFLSFGFLVEAACLSSGCGCPAVWSACFGFSL